MGHSHYDDASRELACGRFAPGRLQDGIAKRLPWADNSPLRAASSKTGSDQAAA